jgi:hypothetical protein
VRTREIDIRNVFVRDPAAVTRVLAGDTVILPVRHNVADLTAIYTLNETGSFVWQQLDGVRSVDDLVGELVAKYDVGIEQARRNVLELMKDLLEEGLVEEKQN